jgi:hypothetical protein
MLTKFGVQNTIYEENKALIGNYNQIRLVNDKDIKININWFQQW